MASKLDYSDNAAFLLKCIESTGVKIDFNKAGPALGLNPNAARMRYARLRRLVEGRLGHSRRSTSSVLRKASIKNVPVKSSNKPEQIKAQGDDVDGDLDDHEFENPDIVSNARNNDSERDLTARRTRGIKVDYSKMLAGGDIGSVSESASEVADDMSSDSLGDYKADFIEDKAPSQFKLKKSIATTPKTSTSKAQTSPATTTKQLTPRKNPADKPLTPPSSKKSIKQVSTSPDPFLETDSAVAPAAQLEKEFVDTFTPAASPPSSKKRARTPSTLPSHKHHDSSIDNTEDNIRDDLTELACGQRVPNYMYKKRRLDNPTFVPSTKFKSSTVNNGRDNFVRLSWTESKPAMTTARNATSGEVVPRDSLAPDDSVSVVGAGGARRSGGSRGSSKRMQMMKNGETTMKQKAKEKKTYMGSLVDKISSIWK